MKIDLHNYEAFFLDYKEGNLSAAQEKELLSFLEKFPELKAELDSYDELVLTPETEFESKKSLKKTAYNDEALIAFVEGDLDEKSRTEIKTLAKQNKHFAAEVNLYKSTILVPETEIVFSKKAKLKRGGVVIYLQNNPVYLRAAAALLLLFGLYFLISNFVTNETKESVKPVLANDTKMENNTTVNNTNDLKQHENKKQLAVTNNNDESKGPRNNKIKQNIAPVKKNDPPVVVSHSVNLPGNQVTVINKDAPDTSTAVVVNHSINNNASVPVSKSFINYSKDLDDDDEIEKQPVTASVAPAKKTFFQKVTDVAKKVNGLGVKKVNAAEDQDKSTVMIGGLVVSETFSN